MPQPKPITLTQVAPENYQGAGEPQPFVVVGDMPVTADPQPAIASPEPTPASFADLAEAREQVHLNRLAIDEILTALRDAGIIAT